MNRRNVLTGLGGLAISGGALFGTGAFTSTSASRQVEVNILGGDDYDANTGVVEGADATAEQNIADEITATLGIDVLVDITSSAVSVESPTGTINNVDELFPQTDVGYDSLTTLFSSGSDNYVSLVANDVRIVFGGDGANEGLPANSTVSFAELFAFGRTDTNTGPDVTFDTSNPSDSVLLSELDDGTTNGDPSSTSVAFTGSTSGDTVDADVATGTADEATEELDITIA
jgi:hypothetical protein